MKRAAGSEPPSGRAGAARTRAALAGVVALALSAGAARADEIPRSPTLTIVPAECTPYWSIPGGQHSPAIWGQGMSFAACVQDASVARIERADQLPGFVEQLHAALLPTVEIYVVAIEHGPDPVKVRAAYQLGMVYVALLTRARSAIAAPADPEDEAAAARGGELHAQLEPLLESTAKVAWILFTAIDRAVADDPSLAPDAMTRNLVRSAREQAELLGRRWAIPREPEAPPRMAGAGLLTSTRRSTP